MGIFSWLFPSVEDRIAKARRLMADQRFAEARLEIIDIEDAAARAVRAEAERALVQLNLQKALEWARAGDEAQVNSHLELAESMHDGSMMGDFEETASQLDVLSKAHQHEQSWQALRTFALRRKKLGTDPGDFTLAAYAGEGHFRLFFGGQRAFNLPSLEMEPLREWFVPAWMVIPGSAEDLTPDEEQASIDALRSQYGSEMQAFIDAQAPVLGRGVLQVAGQRPELAVEALMEADQSNPIVKLELGRAACALGDHLAANLAFTAAIDSLPDASSNLELGALIVAAQYWQGDYEVAYKHARTHLSQTVAEQRLLALTAIAAHEFDAAQAAMSELDEADDARPQLEGFFRLQSRLRALLDEHPALLDPTAENTDVWQAASESVVSGLQETLDEVMGQLKDAEEHMPANL